MCGIAGTCQLTRDASPDEALLRRMLGTLRHRGPDEFGIYLDDAVGLGSARLSILDVSGGQQPITNEDETLWIVFNGEVFNFLELRRELEAEGHRFRTSTDTEVVLHLFERDGMECLSQLNGDFAFAIWNRLTRELFLARDRVGVRPLFYTLADGRLLFASEIKALLADESVHANLDPLALHQVFTFWGPLAPRTAFRGVWHLPPGSYALVRDGETEVRMRRYWEPDFSECRQTDPGPLTEELAALLVEATRLRLRSDVPVAAYLSGGLDSSTIAAIVRRETSSPLETFSIAFSDEQFDEREYQGRVARLLGTQHHVVCADHVDIGRVFPEVVRHAEAPLLRTAPAPMFLLSKLVHEHGFKVALTGEGADEFFGGYDIFKEAKIREFCQRQPTSTRRRQLFRRLYPDIPQFAALQPEFLAAFFANPVGNAAADFASHAVRWRNTARARRFFSHDMAAAVRDVDPAPLPDFARQWPVLARAQYIECTTFLPDYLLCSQGDRPAMAHSVEGRFPFLDYRLIEFAARLPATLKMKALIEKYLLRKVAARWLPPALAQRRKRPYRAPITQSFFGARRESYVDELLSPRVIESFGYFQPRAVAALVSKAERGLPLGETDEMALAGMLSTQLLHQQFVAHPPAATSLGPQDNVKTVRRGSTAARQPATTPSFTASC